MCKGCAQQPTSLACRPSVGHSYYTINMCTVCETTVLSLGRIFQGLLLRIFFRGRCFHSGLRGPGVS